MNKNWHPWGGGRKHINSGVRQKTAEVEEVEMGRTQVLWALMKGWVGWY